jgi:CheY-like chemotaxis protein
VQTILAVDDYGPSRYAHARLLREAGFQVFEAADGRTALEIAQRECPDLVLLDVHLPDIHGFEVCERLKGHRATKDIPVVHITATARGDRFRRESIASGADLFLQEPVPAAELIRMVREVIEKKARASVRPPGGAAKSRAARPRQRTSRARRVSTSGAAEKHTPRRKSGKR